MNTPEQVVKLEQRHLDALAAAPELIYQGATIERINGVVVTLKELHTILSAKLGGAVVPDGYRLVPITLIEDAVSDYDAALSHLDMGFDWVEPMRAMLKDIAAPQPVEVAGDDENLLHCPFCAVESDEQWPGFISHKSSCYFIRKAVGDSPENLGAAWNIRAITTNPIDAVSQRGVAGEVGAPYWVPEHLRKTVCGQAVGLKPLMCESNSASDYCMHCGNEPSTSRPCPSLERLRLKMIPDAEILAFGCQSDADMQCETWCHELGCAFSLKAAAKTPPAKAPEAAATMNYFNGNKI